MRRNNLKANLAQMKANRESDQRRSAMDKESMAMIDRHTKKLKRQIKLLQEQEETDAKACMEEAERKAGITWMTQEEVDRQAELDKQHNYKEGDSVRYIHAPEQPSIWDRIKGWMK